MAIRNNWVNGDKWDSVAVNELSSEVMAHAVALGSLSTAVSGKADASALSGKLDKTADPNYVVYTSELGINTVRPFSSGGVTPSTICSRGTGGVVAVGTPTATIHAATKGYVDDADATKQGRFMTGRVPTAAATVAKVATLDDPWGNHVLVTGDFVLLTWALGQSATAPTMSVNGGPAIPVTSGSGSTSSNNTGVASGTSATTLMYYDGTALRFMASMYGAPSAISAAEIDAGTAGTGRTITGAMARYIQRAPRFTTAGRPAANAATTGAGFSYFDTTLNRPIWSDGTNWRDAEGVVV